MQCGQRASDRDFEERATAISTASAAGPAKPSRPVEVPVGRLHQPDGAPAVSTSTLGAERIRRGEGLCRRGNRRRDTEQKCEA